MDLAANPDRLARPLRTLSPPTLAGTPKIEVEIIPSTEPSMG